jgi:hypothetical protein
LQSQQIPTHTTHHIHIICVVGSSFCKRLFCAVQVNTPPITHGR